MTTKQRNNVDPFQRPSASVLGEVSNTIDNSEEEAAKISSLIPSTATLKAGYEALQAEYEAQAQATSSVFNFPRVPATEEVTPEEPKAPVTPAVSEPVVPAEPKQDESEEIPPEFEDEEVLPILDALLTQGCAKYTFNIRGIDVTLRSQYLWEDQMLMDYVDKQSGPNMNLKVTGSFYYEVYSLATNLERFGGTYFPALAYGKPEELTKSYEDRVNFLKTLPSALVTMITMKRIDFLKRVQFVVANFERLIKVF